MDHFFIGLYLRRKVRFMAKSQMFGPPVLTYIYKHGGVFPVRRGHHDEEAFKTAFTILEQGGMLLVYAEGGRSRSGELGEVKAGDRPDRAGIGAPVVPVAIHGSATVRRWKRLRFPKVTVAVRRAALLPGRGGAEPRAPARGGDARSSTGCGRCTRGWLLVAGAELREELRVVPRGDDRVRVLALEQLQLLQRAAVVVGVEGARRQRRVAVELALRCRWRRRRSRSRARRGGRSPTCGRRCGPGV